MPRLNLQRCAIVAQQEWLEQLLASHFSHRNFETEVGSDLHENHVFARDAASGQLTSSGALKKLATTFPKCDPYPLCESESLSKHPRLPID